MACVTTQWLSEFSTKFCKGKCPPQIVQGNLLTNAAVAADENETLAAGDTVTLSGDIQAKYRFAQPYGGIACVEYNSTAYDDMVLDFAGVGSQVASAPSWLTVASTANTRECYEYPALMSNKKVPFTLTIDVDSGVNPNGQTATSRSHDILLHFMDKDYYMDEDVSEVKGPAASDEDGNQAGMYLYQQRLNID